MLEPELYIKLKTMLEKQINDVWSDGNTLTLDKLNRRGNLKDVVEQLETNHAVLNRLQMLRSLLVAWQFNNLRNVKIEITIGQG